MGKYNVELLPVAYDDLDEIFDYILLNNPSAAGNMLDEIMTSLYHLEDFPNSGVMVTEKSLKVYSFRMVIINPYVAFYRVIGNKVLVYRILHGARNYIHILKPSEFN